MSIRSQEERNMRFYNAADPNVVLGGFFQNGSITEANFLDILEILLVVEGEPGPLRVQERISNHIVSRTDVALKTGAYDIHSQGSIEISDEFFLSPTISYAETLRDRRFRKAVRERDGGKCMISGFEVPQYFNDRGEWPSLEACHVFPLSLENVWNVKRYQDWVAGVDDGIQVGSSGINSVGNGLLL